MRMSLVMPSRGRREEAVAVCGTPPRLHNYRSSSWLLPFFLLALAVGAGAVLFFFDPARHAFYPSCLFYRTTGLQCPACGCLRALHHLLHGELLQAIRFNALLVLSLPFLAVLGLRSAAHCFNPKLRREPLPSAVFWGALALATLFAVARNFPSLAAWFSL